MFMWWVDWWIGSYLCQAKKRFKIGFTLIHPPSQCLHGPFTILDKVGNNAFQLELNPYMQIYSIVNVEKLKLYESPMIVEQDVQVQAPSLDDFSPKYLNKLQEDVILDKKDGSSWRGDM